MDRKKLLARITGGGGLLAVLTLATSGLFKVAAFAREAFIASHFGLSSFTDAYFAFQQFPLILLTFMFGAFGLAFTPAYAAEKRSQESVAWLPGLLLYGSLFGLLLTMMTVPLAPWLLRGFTSTPSAHGGATLVILSCAFTPIIWLGIWAGTTLASGHNVRAMFVTGLPYLVMTLLLIGLYTLGKLDDLSLPLSFLAGFVMVGCYALGSLLVREYKKTDLRAVLAVGRLKSFRHFLRHLAASSIENVGFSANQLLLLFFLAQAGTGVVSANACAMRVGMLGFGLLGQPLAQLVQAKLCAADECARRDVFKKWVTAIAGAVIALAMVLYVAREPIASLVYERGKFSGVALSRVVEIMPAWISYCVVSSLNAIVARYLFAAARGGVYVRRQLCAYLTANAVRAALWGHLSAPLIVWCSVVAEGVALLINLRSCWQPADARVLEPERNRPRVVLHTPEPSSSAALYVEALSKALAAERVPVRLVCPANHQAIPALQSEPAIEVRTCCARGTRTDVSVLTKIWENLRFIASSAATLLQAAEPGDVVHFQYILHLPFGLIFFACAWARRAHIVFTVHDPVPHKFLFPLPWRGIEMTTLRWAYQWSDVLIVHSDAGKRALLEKFQVSAEKIRVIVHGPYELAAPVLPCSETERVEVLFFGSLRENKAPHLAIQAVQRLAAEGVPIRLTIAGQVVNRNEEAYWEGCRKLIDPQCAAIRLMQQFTPDEELSGLFSNCHCFVLPYTTFSSDSGVAYMAMANRKAIISTNAGGLGWLLQESHGGIAIAEPSVEGVAKALRLAVDLGPAQLERMGRTGGEWVLTNCGWPRAARDTRAVYGQWIAELESDSTVRATNETAAHPVEALQ